MTQEQFKSALFEHSPAILAALSGVHLRTLQKIRAGWHGASPGTIDRVQPVLARLTKGQKK